MERVKKNYNITFILILNAALYKVYMAFYVDSIRSEFSAVKK